MQTQATLVGDKRSHYSATLASLGDMQMVMSGEGGGLLVMYTLVTGSDLTSMLRQVQKLNIDDDWLTYFAPRSLYKSPLEPGSG